MKNLNYNKWKESKIFLLARCCVVVLLCLSAETVAFAGISAQKSFSGIVTKVSDGDTIKVRYKGKIIKVRLSEIDCPEKDQAYGLEARAFVRNLTLNKVVTVNFIKKDRYKRTLGEVILPDGRSLNRLLVIKGYAWWYRKYSNDVFLGNLEVKARSQKVGLWQGKDPIPPWQFRKMKRKSR